VRRALVAAVVLVSAEAVLYLSWPHIDDSDPFPSPEIQLGFIATISIFLIPHVLAFLARRDRPSLYLAAGLLGVLVTLATTFSIVMFAAIPLVLIPSCVYLARYHRSPRPRAPVAVTVPLIVVLGVGSVVALFLSNSDQRCYEVRRLRDGTLDYDSVTESEAMYATVNEIGGGCSSDVFAYYETLTSLGLQLLLYRLGWALGTPRSDQSRDAVVRNRGRPYPGW